MRTDWIEWDYGENVDGNNRKIAEKKWQRNCRENKREIAERMNSGEIVQAMRET